MSNFFLKLIGHLRSQKWRDAQEQKDFEAMFEDLPSDRERRGMSEKELAELLSKCKAETPAYILIEHELNRRIAKIQAMPTYIGIISGLAGVVLGAFLNSHFQKIPMVSSAPLATNPVANELLLRGTAPATNPNSNASLEKGSAPTARHPSTR